MPEHDSHGGMGHMDMSMHPMTFHFGTKVTILFDFWGFDSVIGRLD